MKNTAVNHPLLLIRNRPSASTGQHRGLAQRPQPTKTTTPHSSPLSDYRPHEATNLVNSNGENKLAREKPPRKVFGGIVLLTRPAAPLCHMLDIPGQYTSKFKTSKINCSFHCAAGEPDFGSTRVAMALAGREKGSTRPV